MPSGSVADQHAVGGRTDDLADLGQVHAHDFATDPRHHHSRADSSFRANRSEQPGRVVPIVAHHRRTRASFGPDVAQRSLLADTGFVLEPYLDRLASRVQRQRLGYKRGEVFLKASCASRSRLGLCGRGCTRDSPIRRSSLPTVRSCTSTSKRSAI
jgi:hypothetical protein